LVLSHLRELPNHTYHGPNTVNEEIPPVD
jgi:hypothetical protein